MEVPATANSETVEGMAVLGGEHADNIGHGLPSLEDGLTSAGLEFPASLDFAARIPQERGQYLQSPHCIEVVIHG